VRNTEQRSRARPSILSPRTGHHGRQSNTNRRRLYYLHLPLMTPHFFSLAVRRLPHHPRLLDTVQCTSPTCTMDSSISTDTRSVTHDYGAWPVWAQILLPVVALTSWVPIYFLVQLLNELSCWRRRNRPAQDIESQRGKQNARAVSEPGTQPGTNSNDSRG
jgi:hypothetical protein